MGLPRVSPGRKGAAALVRGGHDNCTGAEGAEHHPLAIGSALREVSLDLRTDGTADCETCHMPMFPIAMTEAAVTFECANRHRTTEPLPDDAKLRRFIQNWVARKGAQLEEQHKRWEAERDGQ